MGRRWTCSVMTLVMVVWASPQSVLAQERVWLDVEWSLLWEVAPALESQLLSPALLVGDGAGGVVTYDYGDQQLKRVTRGGSIAWAFGRSGQGPGEFMRPTGLAIVDSTVWVSDPDNSRVTAVALSGDHHEVISVSEVSRAVTIGSGRAVGLEVSAGKLLVEFARDGSRLKAYSPKGFPIESGSIVREALIDGGHRTPHALIAFLHAGKLVHVSEVDGRIEVRMVDAIEPSGFPDLVSWKNERGYTVVRIDPRYPDAARWTSHDEEFFYVAFDGMTDHAGRVVDRYRTGDASYAGSFLLPQEVNYGAIVEHGVLAGLIFEPMPHIKVWSMTIR